MTAQAPQPELIECPNCARLVPEAEYDFAEEMCANCVAEQDDEWLMFGQQDGL